MELENNINDELNYVEQIGNTKKCNSCGAELIFDIKQMNLYCGHCESRYQVKNENFISKSDFNPKRIINEELEEEKFSVKCLNCGAVEIVSNKNLSHICPFCGNTKVITQNNNMYKPQALVPFVIEKNQTPNIFQKWIKKRKLAPNNFKKIAVLDNVKPIYSPVWLFDTKAVSQYEGTLMYDKEVKITYADGNSETKTVTEYKNIQGVRSDTFKDVLINAGERINDDVFNKLAPFNLDNIKVYNQDYLQGYYASNYSTNISEAWKNANTKMTEKIKSNIVIDYNADGYSRLKVRPEYNSSKYAYTLLPVWICSYIYDTKIYNIFINGTTGEITGKSPVSKIKLTILIMLIVALVIFIGYSLVKV